MHLPKVHERWQRVEKLCIISISCEILGNKLNNHTYVKTTSPNGIIFVSFKKILSQIMSLFILITKRMERDIEANFSQITCQEVFPPQKLYHSVKISICFHIDTASSVVDPAFRECNHKKKLKMYSHKKQCAEFSWSKNLQ